MVVIQVIELYIRDNGDIRTIGKKSTLVFASFDREVRRIFDMDIGTSELRDLRSDEYGSTDWRTRQHDSCHGSSGRFAMTPRDRDTFFQVYDLSKGFWIGCERDFPFNGSNHFGIIPISLFKGIRSTQNRLGIDDLVRVCSDVLACMSDDDIHPFAPERLDEFRIAICRT